jgi:hypothetical protein
VITIYTLTDPRTDLVFYVGATTRDSKSVVSRHLSIGYGLRGVLRREKVKPIFEAVDLATEPFEAGILEAYWIWQFRSWGFRLENKRLLSGYAGSSRAIYSSWWWNQMRTPSKITTTPTTLTTVELRISQNV